MPQKIHKTHRVSDDGSLPEAFWQWLREYVRLYAGRGVCFEIGPPKRSTQANKFYWSAVIKPIWEALRDAGKDVSMDTVHRHFKFKYLPVRTEELGGRSYVQEPSTTRLDSTEFSDYVEAIKHDEITLGLGVYIADPDGDFRSYNIHEAV